MKNLQTLQKLIINWAKDKNLLSVKNAPKQRLKLFEEAGELASAYLKNKEQELKDSIGDVFVVLVILAEQLDTSIALDSHGYGNTYLNLDGNIQGIFKYVEDLNVDAAVYTLGCICKDLDLDFVECANFAWNEIKDRTGKTLNGSFIKD